MTDSLPPHRRRPALPVPTRAPLSNILPWCVEQYRADPSFRAHVERIAARAPWRPEVVR